jgi:hypothetical protein
MAATPDDIATGLLDALLALRHDATPAPGPFALVELFASDATATGADKTAPLAPKGTTPAVLLSQAGETYEATGNRAGGGVAGYVGTSTWHVLIVASELRGNKEAMRGDPPSATTGVFALVAQVTAALSGLRIAGLHQNAPVELVDARPVRVKRGEYVWLVRVRADRLISAAEPTDASEPLEQLNADFNLPDETGWPDNPVDQVEADLTE